MAGASTKVALITGASRGIGRAAALEAARRGWHVVALARSQKALESLDDEIRAAGGAAALAPADLKDFDALDRLGQALFERFGKLDALLANGAVLGEITPVFQAKPSMMEEVFATNVLANQRLIRAMDPLLRGARGAAVFVTSRAARDPRAYWGAYAASKAALEALALCYAEEVRVAGVRVHLFDPGRVRTAMRAKVYPGENPAALPAPERVAAALVNLFEAEPPPGGLTVFEGG